MSEGANRTNPLEQREIERRAIRYLREEIMWHRRAGRLLFGFIAGASGTVGLLLLDVTKRSDLSGWGYAFALTPALVPGLFTGAALVYFWKYYRRISTLKGSLQQIIHDQLLDENVKKTWREAFQ